MQIAGAVKPLDHQGKQNEDPIHQHAVGVVVLDMLHPVKILGTIEPLVLDFPAALGQFEQRPILRRKPCNWQNEHRDTPPLA